MSNTSSKKEKKNLYRYCSNVGKTKLRTNNNYQSLFKIPQVPNKDKRIQHEKTADNFLTLDDTLLKEVNLNASAKKVECKIGPTKNPQELPSTDVAMKLHLDLHSYSVCSTITNKPNTKRKLLSETPRSAKKMIILDTTCQPDDSVFLYEDIEMNNLLRDNSASITPEDIFETNQLDISTLSSSLVSATMKHDTLSGFNTTQISSTQIERIFEKSDGLTTNSTHLRELDLQNSQLNALFENVHDDLNNIEEMQSSQRFLTDIKKSNAIPNTNENKIHQLNETQIISTNIDNGSEYIQRQRDMHEVNIQNLNDDILDSDLSQIFKSSQYRKEVESVFNKLEHSICNTLQHPVPEVTNFSQERLDAITGLDDVNWDQHFFNETQTLAFSKNKNSTEIIRRKLNEQYLIGLQEERTRPVSSSFFCNMGPFYGLPMLVKSLIKEYKGIEDLYDWQKECLTLPAIQKRNNLIYALPTSGGKTLVAEILLMREIICRQKNVILILPYVSIVQEKVWGLSPFAVALNFLVEEYAAGNGKCPPRKRRHKKSVYVCTIEKSMSLIDSLIENDRANEIGLIVVDEFHLLGDQSRGIVLESLLTKVMFLEAGIQIIGMSATIGNINELAKFIKADVYTREFRPVELREYIKCGPDILEINAKALSLEDKFEFARTVNFNYTPDVLKIDPDHVAGLVMEVIPEASCLIFCHSKKNCENVAMLLCQVFQKKYLNHNKTAKYNLIKSIRRDTNSPLCSVLRQTLPYGVAYHHSGLISDERRHIEEAFRTGVICVICCTSTLAAGVNLPAQRVILRSPYIGRDIITLSKYKQMAGRAGRAGLGKTGESILICSQKDNIRVSNLLCSPMDEAISAMHLNAERGVRCLLLSAILLKMANTRPDFRRLTDMTLMCAQAKRLKINITQITDNAIEYLIRKKAIKIANSSESATNRADISVKILNTPDNLTSLNDLPSTSKKINVIIKNSSKLEISTLGKASVRACIDLEKASIVYNDLIEAQKNLVLNDNLHLLYIVTPYETAEMINPDMGIYYSLFVKLDPVQQHTARILGINESCAITMVLGKQLKPNMQKIANRFFVALMLNDLWNLNPVHSVAEKFHVDRGIVQNLMNLAACHAASILRFCEEFEEFWPFKELLTYFSKRLSNCCTVELIPLMTLPAVKAGRARQLYNAGYKNLQSIAKSSSQELVNSIEHLSHRVAKQLIAASKLLLLERVETLREEAQDVLDVLNFKN